MPSSFTRDHSRALEYSSRLPVSVCGTVVPCLKLRGFSWQLGITDFASQGLSASRLTYTRTDLPIQARYTLEPTLPIVGPAILLRHPIATRSGTGMLTCFPSTTPFGLALGSDSPCAENRCAGTLGLAACRFFTCIIVTHVSIRTSDISREPHDSPSQTYRTLPYCAHIAVRTRSFGR